MNNDEPKTVNVSLGRIGYIPPERNAPCHCGSGKKFKKCHRLIEHEEQRKNRDAFRARVAAEAAAARAAREERFRSYGTDNNNRTAHSPRLAAIALMASIGMNR